MFILGIESSCDDMAAAVLKDGRNILSNIVSSQDEIHKRYGGIVPELASRKHIESVLPVVDEALAKACVTLEDIEAIAVTRGPGLKGSILVGLSFAKAVAYVLDIPLIGVNHILAHPFSAFLGEHSPPQFPFTALVVSGGHTALFKFQSAIDHEVLGQTRDDAAGEAFDKVAKLLGFTYPGGRVIDKIAREGNPAAIAFKRPYISKKSYDFSFSGIKTAVLNYIRSLDSDISEEDICNIAASFQEAVVDVLVQKAFLACEANQTQELVVAGGVACNSRLRGKLAERATKNGINLHIPPPQLCSDNGAMIAASGYNLLLSGKKDNLDLDADPRLTY